MACLVCVVSQGASRTLITDSKLRASIHALIHGMAVRYKRTKKKRETGRRSLKMIAQAGLQLEVINILFGGGTDLLL